MITRKSYKSVIFAGGGCRCVWQTGFWQVAAEPLGLTDAVIGSVSAGAAMACLVRSGRIPEGMAVFKRLFSANPKNYYIGNFFSKRPVFPQYLMFSQGLSEVLDEQAVDRLKTGPEIRVLLAKPPGYLPAWLAALAGMTTYTLEKKLLRPVHPAWAVKIGFRPETVTVQSCRSPREVAALILQSSCTPPVVPVQYRNGETVLDGGLVDNVPVLTVADRTGPVLVLLTRRYGAARFQNDHRCHYLQPSQTPPISRWDYTSPHGLQQTFDLGRKDAEIFIRDLERGKHGLHEYSG